MEDREIKKAYMYVIDDMKRYCQAHSDCSDCELYEACNKTDYYLFELVAEAKDLTFGKDEEDEE